MALIFNDNRIIEKDYKVKQYFSDKPATTLKLKCYSCLLVFMMLLFGLNMYQLLIEMSVVNSLL